MAVSMFRCDFYASISILSFLSRPVSTVNWVCWHRPVDRPTWTNRQHSEWLSGWSPTTSSSPRRYNYNYVHYECNSTTANLESTRVVYNRILICRVTFYHNANMHMHVHVFSPIHVQYIVYVHVCVHACLSQPVQFKFQSVVVVYNI